MIRLLLAASTYSCLLQYQAHKCPHPQDSCSQSPSLSRECPRPIALQTGRQRREATVHILDVEGAASRPRNKNLFEPLSWLGGVIAVRVSRHACLQCCCGC